MARCNSNAGSAAGESDVITVSTMEGGGSATSQVAIIPYEELKLGRKLDSGSFKTVYEGRWQGGAVAIARLHNAQGTISHEVAIMAGLRRHPNLVQCYGMAVGEGGQDMYVVMELLPLGSLTHVLRDHGQKIDARMRLDAIVQICSGMLALGRAGIVHADLAARNVLVQSIDPKLVVKVGDFGLAKTNPLYYGEKDQIPVRWSSPEVILRGKWTEKSDVWAFGVTVWEIYMDAYIPFGLGLRNREVSDLVVAGKLLSQPPSCPDDVWEVVQRCWIADETARPTFGDVMGMLEAIGGGGRAGMEDESSEHSRSARVVDSCAVDTFDWGEIEAKADQSPSRSATPLTPKPDDATL